LHFPINSERLDSEHLQLDTRSPRDAPTSRHHGRTHPPAAPPDPQIPRRLAAIRRVDRPPLQGQARPLQLKALTPTASTPQNHLALARETYEQGALVSIRNRKTDPFTRYVQQLQPFYELPASSLPPNLPERNKVTGLYLLLLLTQGRYSEFHSELESLAIREGGGEGSAVEDDRYLGYPIRLERWLMEGSYDRVWKAMKNREVPSEEYGVFSEVCSVTRLLSRATG
jgi:CSN8/PSMD8/EIF3K family protein